MKRPRRMLNRLRRMALRGLLAAGLLPKLLIPVGFMPAALADGGPLTVCSGYGWPQALTAGPRVMPVAHAMHGDMTQGDTHAPDGVPGGGAEHGDGHGRHHQWDRCSFAGASSSSPVAPDWHLDLFPVGAEVVSLIDPLPIESARLVPFRSRAPPIRHS